MEPQLENPMNDTEATTAELDAHNEAMDALLEVRENRDYAAAKGVTCADCGHGDPITMALEGCACCMLIIHCRAPEWIERHPLGWTGRTCRLVPQHDGPHDFAFIGGR